MGNLSKKLIKATFVPLIMLAFAGADATNIPIGTSCQSIKADPADLPIAYDVTGDGGHYCQGDVGLPVGVANSETGVTYTLYMDDITTGQTIPGSDGSPITFGNQVVPDQNIEHVFTVKGTNVEGTTDMNGSVSILEMKKITPSVSIWSDAPAIIIQGTTNVMFYAVTESGGDPTFQWYKNGLPVGNSDYLHEEYNPANNDQFYVEVTYPWSCVTTPYNTVISNTITLVVVNNIWTGTAGNFWNNAVNWQPTTIPSSGADVYIPIVSTHNLYIPDAISCHNMIIDGASNLRIRNTGSLTISGTLTLNGSDGLYIESDAGGTGSLIDNGIAGTGTANVQRYLTTNAWHYLSSPVNNATAGVFNNDYLKTSDPSATTGWGDYIVDPSTPLEVMRGYACWKPTGNLATETFIGNLNTGSKTFTFTDNGAGTYQGWHLVGNPYPSAVNLSSAGISWGTFEPTAYFWDQSGTNPDPYSGGGNYDVYPQSGNWGTHNEFAPAMQGFFILNGTPGITSLTLPNSARVHNGQAFLKTTQTNTNGMIICARSYVNNFTDKISVHFDPDATQGYDPGYDAYKLLGLKEAPQLYTRIGNTNVTCNALPFEQKNMVVPMGFTCGLPGTYALIADSLSTFVNTISITLEDLKLNTTQDLRTNAVYTFNYDTIDNPNRFLLHFDNPGFGVNDHGQQNDLQIYSYENFLYVRKTGTNPLSGKMTLYDLLGKELYTFNLTDSPLSKYKLNLNADYYVVKIITPDSVYLQKVLIRR